MSLSCKLSQIETTQDTKNTTKIPPTKCPNQRFSTLLRFSNFVADMYAENVYLVPALPLGPPHQHPCAPAMIVANACIVIWACLRNKHILSPAPSKARDWKVIGFVVGVGVGVVVGVMVVVLLIK